MLLLVALGMVGCASAPQPEVASKIEVSMVEPVIEPEASQTPDVNEILTVYKAVSYTHLTLPTIQHWCRSRWSPYH